MLLCVQKITTGNASKDSWNILESKKVQKTLALIISDYIEAKSKVGMELTSKIPKYIRALFEHYCSKNIKPDFTGIDQIQAKMAVKLQRYIFIDIIGPELGGMIILDNYYTEQQISHEKVLVLFPNAMMYINDQSQQIAVIKP